MEPVELVQMAVCEFRAKLCGACGRPKSNKAHRKDGPCVFRRQLGCAVCGRFKGDAAHFGEPPSLNVLAGRDPNVYRSLIEQWKALLGALLAASDLPHGCARIVVEGEAVFPIAKARDQGNHRVVVEKALGDALVDGGWLPDDSWDRYEFGGLAQRVEAGVSATRLLLFPTLAPADSVAIMLGVPDSYGGPL